MRNRLLVTTLFMLFSPLLGFYTSFKTNNRTYIKWVAIIFITFYGSLIVFGDSSDGREHREAVVEHYVGLSLSDFIRESIDIITFTTNDEVNEDLYIHTLSFLCGGVLNAPGLFYVFVAFVYGYFLVNSILLVLGRFPGWKGGKFVVIFALAFLVWKNIEGVNTVRTWSGLWVLFYSSISYFQTGKMKYGFLMFAPPLFHVGYFVMAIPAWIVLFLRERKLLYSTVFILSFVFSSATQGTILENLSQLEVGQEKIDGYYRESEGTIEDTLNVHNDKTWYKKAYELRFHSWSYSIIAAMLIIFGYYFRTMTSIESKLFSIGILNKALSNITWFLSALYERSDVVGGLFVFAAFVLMLNRGVFTGIGRRSLPQWVMITTAAILMFPLFVFRLSEWSYLMSVFLAVAPFVAWIAPDINTSFRQLISLISGL